MSVFQKQLQVKVYSPTGQFITNWPSVNFTNFSKELSSGLGECVLQTAFAFDYAGGDLLTGNQVDLVVSDVDTAAAAGNSASVLIYRGYISLIERDVDGQSEGVIVHLIGYYTLLSLDILKNGTQTTLYSYSTSGITATLGSQNAADIGMMMRAVIDRYRAENTNPKISYDFDDIPNTGTTAIYTFKQSSYRAALDDLRALAPSGYFYYIDERGKVKCKPKPSTPTHKFIFGRHFKKVHVESSLEKVRNFILIWDGGSNYKHYEDDASIATYGRRAQTDNDYTSSATGVALQGARFLADNAQPDLRVTCTIMDNNGDSTKGYDIESIQPGDTCSFYGFASGASEIFRDNMIITKVVYSLDSAEITVEIIKSSLIDEQANQATTIHDIGSGGLQIPTTYT